MDGKSRNQVDWNYLSRDWPDLIYLRKVEELPNFPWTSKYFRSLCCGQAAKPELKDSVVHVSGLAAMEKPTLVNYMFAVCKGGK